MDLTEQIKQFIDDMPDDYGFSKDDASYISRYQGCSVPPFAYISHIQEIVKEKYPVLTMDYFSGHNIRALCYGYSSDMALSNTQAIITSYQDDYYCFRVTQGVHYDKVVEGEHSVLFRNLADFFIDYKGNNKRYDIAIIFPQDTIYHTIDADSNFADLSPYAYYTLRGVYFVKPKGLLVALVPSQYVGEIKANQNLISSENAKIEIINDGDYAIIKITK